jgi:hypothetical protein
MPGIAIVLVAWLLIYAAAITGLIIWKALA